MSWFKQADYTIEDLKSKLLELGGERFQVDSFLVGEISSQELPDLMTQGSVRQGNVEMCQGEPIRCHENAAHMVLEGGEGWVLWTGLALSDDGIWRVHSWAENPEGSLIETTEPRDIYFGIVVDDPKRLIPYFNS